MTYHGSNRSAINKALQSSFFSFYVDVLFSAKIWVYSIIASTTMLAGNTACFLASFVLLCFAAAVKTSEFAAEKALLWIGRAKHQISVWFPVILFPAWLGGRLLVLLLWLESHWLCKIGGLTWAFYVYFAVHFAFSYSWWSWGVSCNATGVLAGVTTIVPKRFGKWLLGWSHPGQIWAPHLSISGSIHFVVLERHPANWRSHALCLNWSAQCHWVISLSHALYVLSHFGQLSAAVPSSVDSSPILASSMAAFLLSGLRPKTKLAILGLRPETKA